MSIVIFFSELNVAYNNCNWNVKVLTQTAASNHEGRGEFISDNNFPCKNSRNWGQVVINLLVYPYGFGFKL